MAPRIEKSRIANSVHERATGLRAAGGGVKKEPATHMDGRQMVTGIQLL